MLNAEKLMRMEGKACLIIINNFILTFSAPNTTTTPATTTTASPPVPTPDPSMGKWNVTDGGNVCVILYAAIQLKIPYVTTGKRSNIFDDGAKFTNT